MSRWKGRGGREGGMEECRDGRLEGKGKGRYNGLLGRVKRERNRESNGVRMKKGK